MDKVWLWGTLMLDSNVPNADSTEIMEQQIYGMAASNILLPEVRKGPTSRRRKNFHDNP